jgi:hypothetical protein
VEKGNRTARIIDKPRVIEVPAKEKEGELWWNQSWVGEHLKLFLSILNIPFAELLLGDVLHRLSLFGFLFFLREVKKFRDLFTFRLHDLYVGGFTLIRIAV